MALYLSKKNFTKCYFGIIILFSFFSQSYAVERIEPKENTSIWQVDNFKIYVAVRCSVSHLSVWPIMDCQPPYIEIEEQKNTSLMPITSFAYFSLDAGDISLGYKSMFPDSESAGQPRLSASDAFTLFSPHASEPLYRLLISRPDTHLTLKTRIGIDSPAKTRTFILEDFSAKSSEYLQSVRQRYSEEEASAQKKSMFGLIVLFFILAITIWLALILIRWVKKLVIKAKQKSPNVFNQMGNFTFGGFTSTSAPAPDNFSYLSYDTWTRLFDESPFEKRVNMANDFVHESLNFALILDLLPEGSQQEFRQLLISDELRNFHPIKLIAEWTEYSLAHITNAIGKRVLLESPARVVGTLMLVSLTSLAPERDIKLAINKIVNYVES